MSLKKIKLLNINLAVSRLVVQKKRIVVDKMENTKIVCQVYKKVSVKSLYQIKKYKNFNL